MIKIVNQKNVNDFLYTCVSGDTLENIASRFGTSVVEIQKANPLLTSVYNGCMILLTNLGKTRVIVQPMQTLDDIAKQNNTTVESIKMLNNLKSDRLFVGMQLLIEDKNGSI